MLVQPTDAPDLDAIMAAQQPAAAPAAAAAAAASSVADAAPARPSQGYMPPPPARAAKQRRQQSQLAQQAPPPSSQEQQQQQQGKGRKRHIDEDDDDELEEQGCDVEQDSDDGVTADKPDPVARLNGEPCKSAECAAKQTVPSRLHSLYAKRASAALFSPYVCHLRIRKSANCACSCLRNPTAHYMLALMPLALQLPSRSPTQRQPRRQRWTQETKVRG